jgi:drug/metabolite transporter (DMT)-like permease
MKAFSRLGPTPQGILLMMSGIFMFTVMDAMAKGLAARHDPFQVVWARYTFQTLIVSILLAPRLGTVLKTNYLWLQLIRSAFLFGATVCFFFGIVLLGLAPTSAVMSINPLLITIGAVFLLGERLGPRRLAGVVAGLVGALIIIRPGLAVFEPAALLPVGSALFYSGYMLSTRFLGREESIWTSFLYTAAIGTIVASLVVPMFWTAPSATDWGLMLVLGGVGALGQFLIISALMRAAAGAVAPFAYIGPPFAAIWGMLFFDEYPDIWVGVGAALIIGSGLYVWHRERARAKKV